MKTQTNLTAKNFPQLAERAKRNNRSMRDQLIHDNEMAISEYELNHPFHKGDDVSIDPVTGAKMF